MRPIISFFPFRQLSLLFPLRHSPLAVAAAWLKAHRSPVVGPRRLGHSGCRCCAAWICRSSAPPPIEPRPRQLSRAVSQGQDLDDALAAMDTSSPPEAAVVAVHGEPSSISGSVFCFFCYTISVLFSGNLCFIAVNFRFFFLLFLSNFVFEF